MKIFLGLRSSLECLSLPNKIIRYSVTLSTHEYPLRLVSLLMSIIRVSKCAANDRARMLRKWWELPNTFV